MGDPFPRHESCASPFIIKLGEFSLLWTIEMRILYASYLTRGSTGLQRARALRQIGHELVCFDFAQFRINSKSLLRRIANRLEVGSLIHSINESLVSFASDKTVDWVWIDKGKFVRAATVKRLKEITGAKVVHFTPDPAITFHRTRTFVGALPHYDLLITTKRYEIERYRELGAQSVVFVEQGFDPEVFFPRSSSTLEEKYGGHRPDVVFVGHSEPHYRQCIKRALRVTRNVVVGGGEWRRLQRNSTDWAQICLGRDVWEDEYSELLQRAKVSLGLLSRLAPDASTTRTYEIPASGGLLLAERTAEHLALFREDEEAVFFSGYDELERKLKFLLANDDVRVRVANGGYRRCIENGYSYADRFREMFIEIERSNGAGLR
jgi:spore maturation protein CgeB